MIDWPVGVRRGDIPAQPTGHIYLGVVMERPEYHPEEQPDCHCFFCLVDRQKRFRRSE